MVVISGLISHLTGQIIFIFLGYSWIGSVAISDKPIHNIHMGHVNTRRKAGLNVCLSRENGVKIQTYRRWWCRRCWSSLSHFRCWSAFLLWSCYTINMLLSLKTLCFQYNCGFESIHFPVDSVDRWIILSRRLSSAFACSQRRSKAKSIKWIRDRSWAVRKKAKSNFYVCPCWGEKSPKEVILLCVRHLTILWIPMEDHGSRCIDERLD